MPETTTVQIPDDHEEIRVVQDVGTGLRCVIAVHCTRLGPAIGGLRHTHYGGLREAIDDALRLAAAMTQKTSLAGLPIGGGKAVLLADDEGLSPRRIEALAAVLDDLGGRYVAAEDIGTSPADMDALSEHTRWVAGRSPDRGGAGDPSPATAQTVFMALASAAGARLEGRELSRVTATVVGVGKVGADVARRLAAAGATVHVSDLNPVRAATIAREIDATPLTLHDALRSPVDVLVPCARGGYLTTANVGQLAARVVCGAANNILDHDDLADRLHAAGVLYVPDFVANSGGIIQVAGEFLGWDRERIAIQVHEAGQRVAALLQAAERAGVAPLHIAREMADQRLVAEPVAVAA